MNIFDTDSYKCGHFLQVPETLTSTFAYLESRGGRYGETVFFGLRGLLNEHFSTPVTADEIEAAASDCNSHGEPFPLEGWHHILNRYSGHLPLHIRAVPEGSVVPVRNVLMTVESTDPLVPWVPGWFETQFMRLWYPITVATRSYYCKKVIFDFLKKTSDDPLGELPFKLHDFGARGVSSQESAEIGGAAHLVNFMGTDTMVALRYLRRNYRAAMAGFSIPAMEHTTVIVWGRDGEEAAFRNMLQKNTHNVVACVSDTYDFAAAVEQLWGDRLLDEVKASGKMVVIRPDSGNAAAVNLEALRILERKVGMTTNSKGYKVLPKYYRLIQGDGNDTEDDIRDVLQALEHHGYSASNIAFGMGGGLLQKLDRDTQRFAYKTSAAVVDGKEIAVRKTPKTDATKSSKAGRLDLVRREGGYQTIVRNQGDPGLDSELVDYYRKGVVLYQTNLDQIRHRANKAFR